MSLDKLHNNLSARTYEELICELRKIRESRLSMSKIDTREILLSTQHDIANLALELPVENLIDQYVESAVEIVLKELLKRGYIDSNNQEELKDEIMQWTYSAESSNNRPRIEALSEIQHALLRYVISAISRGFAIYKTHHFYDDEEGFIK